MTEKMNNEKKSQIKWDFTFPLTHLRGIDPGESLHERIIDTCLKAGAAGIEGAVYSLSEMSESELSALGQKYRAAGLEIPTFHLPFAMEDDISSFYETERRAIVFRMRSWMEKARLLGSRTGIIHPGTKGHCVRVEGMDGFISALGKSLGELLPAAHEIGLTLALENTLPREPGCHRFGSRPEHLARISREFTHPALKFCLDTGHALIAMRERAGEFFSVLGEEIVAYHLQDNAGDRDSHLAPGHGRVNWREVFTGMRRNGFSGRACIEAPPFDFGRDYAPEAWRRLYLETRELALGVH